ncbi:MAG: CpsD/CapB family tyrosine-protein kinase [Clostridiales bacterium]|nr:CpsD/CapB family tyrosine-protein kinase [Clostridiales bacterium]
MHTQLSKQRAFQISEAYKTIRANLLFAISPFQNKAMLVASAEPNAGKSITSANIAITIAQTGAKVLLIDADMRNPSQHKIFRVNNNNGLSKIISGLSSFDSDSYYEEVSPSLDLITSGPTPPNPSELLVSANMQALIDHVSSIYDYIIIDTPPISVVADALVLLSKIPPTLIIARQRQTNYDDLNQTIHAIKRLNGHLLGIVITDMQDIPKRKNVHYSHYYDSYFE